jgi:uncharacterized membrane protein
MTHLPDESLVRLEELFGKVLVSGVVASAILLSLGLLFWMLGFDGAWDQRLLNTGLVTLMLTPIARVVVSAVEYTRRRDWFFAATSAAVLVVLAFTIAIAFMS